MRFPDDFRWGVATASYQIEGAVSEDGRSPSIWDTFSHTPGKTLNGDTGDVANDHYHRWPEDLDLLAELGVDLYRFSLAWPRLQPSGRGALNEAGVDFYARLVDALLERGVEPWVTLYHWDLPQALQDAGGWPERETAERFAEYAALVHERLQRPRAQLDDAERAVVLGVPRPRRGPPRARAPRTTTRRCASAHHLLLGHGLAVGAMRAQRPRRPLRPDAQPLPRRPGERRPGRRRRRAPHRRDRQPAVPRPGAARPRTRRGHRGAPAARRRRARDRRAARHARRQLLQPPRGARRATATARAARRGSAARDVEFVKRGLPRTEMGWEIDAQGLYDVLTRLHREYPRLPLYVTENGAAFADEPAADGSVSTRIGSPTSTATSARPTAPSPTGWTCAATSCGR